MTFAHPSLLLLLALPVILAFWEWTRAGQTLVMPFDHGRQRRGWFLHVLVLSANTLPALLLAVAIVFLARPITFAPPQTERKLTNIQIVLDSSGSMSTPYGSQSSPAVYSRFDAAFDAIDQLLTHRKGDAFGLTIFSRAYIHWVPLTLDTDAIRLSRPLIRVFTLPPNKGGPTFAPAAVWGGTFVAKALGGAIDVLAQRPAGDRMIILLTDGESSDIQRGHDRDIIERLRQNRITVFAVNLAGEVVEPGLVHIAEETGGQVFSVVDNDALRAVFRQIDEMKRVEILQKEPQVIDYFHPFLWAAAAILALQTLALFGLRFNPW